MILAESLAGWLAKAPPRRFGKREKIRPATFQKDLSGRTGVIFFKDYWQRTGQSFEGRTGDHIDLWDRRRITQGSMTYFGIMEFLGLVSDFNKCKEIWFWEVG